MRGTISDETMQLLTVDIKRWVLENKWEFRIIAKIAMRTYGVELKKSNVRDILKGRAVTA